MNSILPLSSFKRDEIYTFIGGFFIACSWYLHTDAASATGLSDITKPQFWMFWLLSTALLYIIYLVVTSVIYLIISHFLKKKSNEELKKILGIKDPVEDFIFSGYVDDVRMGTHIIGIMMISILLSVYPLNAFINSYIAVRPVSYSIIAIIIVLTLIYFLCLLFVRFVAISFLRVSGTLEIIDQNTFLKERAVYAAYIANEASKQKIQNFINAKPPTQQQVEEKKKNSLIMTIIKFFNKITGQVFRNLRQCRNDKNQ